MMMKKIVLEEAKNLAALPRRYSSMSNNVFRLYKTLFLFLFFWFSLLDASAVPGKVDLSLANHSIGKSMMMYEDSGAKMTFSQIRTMPSAAFTPLKSDVASHAFNRSAFWYRFSAENRENTPLSRLIVFEPPWLDSVNVTVVSPRGVKQHYYGGNKYPYAQRAIDHTFINFRHLFEPGVSTVYVQVKTPDPFIVAVSILDERIFLAEQLDKSKYIGFIYGIIIAMLLYNLFLYFGIKERYYAYYVLYLSAFLMMNASYNGYTFKYLFYQLPYAQDWATSSFIYLYSITGLLFARSFLNLKMLHPGIDRFTIYVILFYIGTALLFALMGDYRLHVRFSIALSVLFGLYLFSIAFYSWRKGNRSARFFLLGTTSGLIGAVITALTVMAIVPYSYAGYKAVDFGMVLDAILLSMALADRIQSTHEEKLLAELAAKTDSLTGMLNRRAYEEISSREFEWVSRYDKEMSLMMFDIDYFKKVNDTYGHDVGDRVLQRVADILNHFSRKSDYIFRRGGDEFLLLFPKTNKDEAAHLAERIREEVEKIELKINDNTISITVSIGFTNYLRDDENVQRIEKRADEALYKAKEAGRNNVVFSEVG